MIALIKDYYNKAHNCTVKIQELIKERSSIVDGEFNQNSYHRDRYNAITNEIIELRIKAEVFKEVHCNLVAYFTVNA